MDEVVLKIKNLNATYGGLLALNKFNMDVKNLELWDLLVQMGLEKLHYLIASLV